MVLIMLLCFSATWLRDIKFWSKLSNLIVIMELIIIKLFCKKTSWCLIIIKFDNMRIKYDNHKAKIIKKPDNIRINTIGGNVINQNVESSH